VKQPLASSLLSKWYEYTSFLQLELCIATRLRHQGAGRKSYLNPTFLR
jgi:hypothetical protein